MGEPQQTLLILDDEKLVRESLAYYFEDHGWRVLLADTGEQALELLDHESPDCAVVDIRLPGMNGSQFIRKAHDILPRMGFVICTGSPGYHLPSDMTALPFVSDTVTRKPIRDIIFLKQELHSLIERLRDQGDANE